MRDKIFDFIIIYYKVNKNYFLNIISKNKKQALFIFIKISLKNYFHKKNNYNDKNICKEMYYKILKIILYFNKNLKLNKYKIYTKSRLNKIIYIKYFGEGGKKPTHFKNNTYIAKKQIFNNINIKN